MKSALSAIEDRISIRTYDTRPIDNTLTEKINKLCRESGVGPFGSTPRLQLLDLGLISESELKSYGTYGFIRGARLFILGAVKEELNDFLDLGYCLEKIILEVTALGLGTCWLGGTFKRNSFAATMELAEDELLPAITPVGYPAAERSIVDKIIRRGAGSHRRKPWSELYFTLEEKKPLLADQTGSYKEVLEAVRIGPSASNRQPWRIVLDRKGRYHLFLKEDKLYNRMLGKVNLQMIDMGIAICHFELASAELGLKGGWSSLKERPHFNGLQYIISWVNN